MFLALEWPEGKFAAIPRGASSPAYELHLSFLRTVRISDPISQATPATLSIPSLTSQI